MTSALVLAPPKALACLPRPVTIEIRPNPFRSSTRRLLRVPHGSTVAQLVEEALELEHGPVARRYQAKSGWRVWVNGLEVPSHLQTQIVPPPDSRVTIRLIPGFGIGAIIGGIAAAAAAAAAGALPAGLAAAVYGLVYIGVYVTVYVGLWAVVGYAAYAVVRSLTAGQTPGRLGGLTGSGSVASSSEGTRAKSDSPTISGQGNSPIPFDVHWRIFGKYRIRPYVVGKPYTEVSGGSIFLRTLYCCGYGPLKVSDIRIGTTSIGDFNGSDIEVIQGWQDDHPGQTHHIPSALYPGSAVQEEYQIRLHSNAGGSTGNDKVRTTALNTTEVGVEISFPGGFQVYDDLGEELDRTMKFHIRYRVKAQEGQPLNDWADPKKGVDEEVFKVSSKHGSPKITDAGKFEISTTVKQRFFVGVRFFPGRHLGKLAPNQYEVNVIVTNSIKQAHTSTIVAEAFWDNMVSHTPSDAITMKGMCLIAVRLKATNQLSGAVDTLNCVVESYLRRWHPDTGWSGAALPNASEVPIGWSLTEVIDGETVSVSQNPAWQVLEMLTGSAQRAGDRLADEHIDLQRFYEFAQHCYEHGLKCNAPIDFGATTYQTMKDILSTGWASPHMRDGKVSVVWERDTRNEPPVALITPRNIVATTFKGMKGFDPLPHAFRVRYQDAEQDWEFDEVNAFDDDYDETNASDYAELELWGVTDHDLAWQFGRRRMAELKLRPEIYAVEQDFEHLYVERGDLIALAHDVPLFGLAYGTVKSHSPDAITLDEEMTFEPAKLYGCTIRNPSSPFLLITVNLANPATTAPVKTRTLTFEVSFAPEDPVQLGALVSMGERGIETRRCIVKQIEPLEELNAKLTLVDEAVGIWDALTDEIPPYDPGISLPIDAGPRSPSITNLYSVGSSIFLEIRPNIGGAIPPRYFEVWWREALDVVGEEADWTRLQLIDVDGVETVELTDVSWGRYDFQARAIGGLLSRMSAWTTIYNFEHRPSVEALSPLRATGLVLHSSPNSDSFRGREPEFEIRLNSILVPDDFTAPIVDLDTATQDVLDYEWRIMDPVTRTLVRTDHTADRRYTYTLAKQDADGVLLRTFWVGAAVRDLSGVPGRVSWLEVSNLPPRISYATVAGGSGVVTAVELRSPDRDTVGFLLWGVSFDDYPDPSDAPIDDTTLRADGQGPGLVWVNAPVGLCWVWLAAYDDWGKEPETLALVGPYSVTVS